MIRELNLSKKLNNDFQSYSQEGEDIIIKNILDIIEDNKEEEKWCVEFGAWDGIHASNTYHFIKEENYKAVLIEGDKNKFNELNENMKGYDVDCICKYVTFEGENRLDNILGKTKLPKDFALLSIDIDGNDYYIWESLIKYRPKLVVIEFNPTISNEVEFVQEKDFSLNHGCSPLSLVKLAELKGYKLIHTTVNNCFFIDQKYFDLFGLEDNSLCKLRTDLSHVTYIFNGYDGYIFVRGYNRLYLHTLPYNEKRMQMIPKWLLGWNIQNKFLKTFQRLHRSLRKRNIV